MADKVRWGILSTANIGRVRVIPAIQKSRNGVVAAVASRDQHKAQTFAADLNIPTAYGSYEELLADPSIDAIYNPLPNSLHAEWSIKCAEAGKATLCEKPLASNAGEAQHMVDEFARLGVLFAEAFMYRFHPRAQRAKELIDTGAIGDVRFIQASFTFDITGREDDVRLSKPLAGGSLMDIGCYCVNVMRLMTGEEPDRVQAFARIGQRSGVDENMVGILDFPSGVLGHFDCGFRSPATNFYEIRGATGRIVVEPAFVSEPTVESVIRYWDATSGSAGKTITVPAVDQYQLMVEDFASALVEGHPPRYLPQDGVQNMHVIDRLYASLSG